MSYILKNMHFIVIHVPIAMLLFSLVFDVLALLFKKKDWHTAGLLSLIVGTLGAIAAVMTGPEDRNPLFPTHELFGKLTMAFFIALTVVRVWMLVKKRHEIGMKSYYLAAALIGVILVTYTGHLGGKMVHPDRNGQFREGGFQQKRADISGGQQPSQSPEQPKPAPAS